HRQYIFMSFSCEKELELYFHGEKFQGLYQEMPQMVSDFGENHGPRRRNNWSPQSLIALAVHGSLTPITPAAAAALSCASVACACFGASQSRIAGVTAKRLIKNRS